MDHFVLSTFDLFDFSFFDLSHNFDVFAACSKLSLEALTADV